MRRLLRFGSLLGCLSLVAFVFALGCKTPGSGSGLRSSDAEADPCLLADSWAGAMGMRLVDGSGGARIDCVVVGQGLHHIGLLEGDVIIALNDGVKVSGAGSFEATATKLATREGQGRIHHWEFDVSRAGRTVRVVPPRDYPGCGLFAFDDCGPLSR